MYMFIDHDWKSLSKPRFFSYFSLMNSQCTNRSAFQVMVSGHGGPSASLQQAHPFTASYTSSLTPLPTGPLNANSASTFLTGRHLPIFSPMLPQVDIPLKRADYSGVQFWTRPEWINHLRNIGDSTSFDTEHVRGKTLVSRGINKMAKYIEDASGNPVDGYKLKDMLTHMRSIWSSLLSLNRAPTTWGKADMETLHYFRREMRVRFPEFALCENDWKADYLATTHYPSWYSNHVKGATIKEEAEDPVDVGADQPVGSKRPAAEQSTSSQPKKKTKKVTFVCSMIKLADFSTASQSLA